VGLTGSGLLSLIHELHRIGVITAAGRLVDDHPTFGHRLGRDAAGVRRLGLTADGSGEPLFLTQKDVRELQKAKAAVSAAMETLMDRLDLEPTDLQKVFLTGSFGSQLDVAAVVGIGMIPSVSPGIVETPANGAGFGAALFLDDAEFARGERLAKRAEQIDLDIQPDFIARFIDAMALPDGN
jgi:uncharacterized 2Fe-2S/4Fe-4S cluster protein (DUF4445 family)